MKKRFGAALLASATTATLEWLPKDLEGTKISPWTNMVDGLVGETTDNGAG